MRKDIQWKRTWIGVPVRQVTHAVKARRDIDVI